MRGQWFYDIEEAYIASIEGAREAYKEAKASLNEAQEELEEALENIKRFYRKYPPDYDGPAPLY